MRRKFVTYSTLLMLISLFISTPFCDAKSFSQSFKLIVYIPPHVITPESPVAQIRQAQNDDWAETTFEEVMRDDQRILLQTTVLR